MYATVGVSLWTAVSTLALCGQGMVCQKGRRAFISLPNKSRRCRNAVTSTVVFIMSGCHPRTKGQHGKIHPPLYLVSHHKMEMRHEWCFCLHLSHDKNILLGMFMNMKCSLIKAQDTYLRKKKGCSNTYFEKPI